MSPYTAHTPFVVYTPKKMIFRIKQVVVGAIVFITCAQAFPSENRQPRQDEDGEGFNPVNVGASVAQIIAGAFTGNIDSIIKGSFGFIEDPNVNKLSHNTWETLKGKPTKTPPWATTESDADPDSETEAPSRPPSPSAAATAPQTIQQQSAQPPPKRQEVEAPPPPPPAVAPTKAPAVAVVESEPQPVVAAAPPKRKVVSYRPVVEAESPFGSQSYGSVIVSGDYPTKSPVRARSTQPTYATLAPLDVINGVTEPEPSTRRTTTEEDDDDGDEAEAFSAEY